MSTKKGTRMIAGLPGTGIGGLFYLLSALLMPFLELLATLRGRSSAERWRVVRDQTLIAGGIILGVSGTYWIIGLILLPLPSVSPGAATGMASLASQISAGL